MEIGAGEPGDITLLIEWDGPVRLPVWPCLAGGDGVASFAPCLSEASALEHVIASRCYHRGFRDGDVGVFSKLLARLLFVRLDGEREAEIDACAEYHKVFVDLVLGDLTVTVADVVDYVEKFYVVETFVGIVQPSVVDGVDDGNGKVDSNAFDMDEYLPCFLVDEVLSTDTFMHGGAGSSRDGRIVRRSVHRSCDKNSKDITGDCKMPK